MRLARLEEVLGSGVLAAFVFQLLLLTHASASAGELVWPIDGVPGQTCNASIGYPDIDGDGRAFDCGPPGYAGHQGTDIRISWDQMDIGIAVLAAADGVVLWTFDGKYDRCPDPYHPDCQPPPPGWAEPGQSNGYSVCTPLGPFCGRGTCCCFWCFYGGNVVVIQHDNVPEVFATRYDHLRKGSIVVAPGQRVTRGQKIAEAGSAGHSTGPHLHFEVWGTGFYELDDPWAGPCGPRFANSLWKYDPPWDSPVVLDIRANGSDGPVTILSQDTLSVTVTINPVPKSRLNADWWVVADTPFGWYRYDVASGLWNQGFTFTYQGPLFAVTTPFEVLRVSGLPAGTYTFYFGIDTTMNGSVDFDRLYYDGVIVRVAEDHSRERHHD